MRFNTTADGRLETVETIHDAEEHERQLRSAIARDRGTLRRMLEGNAPFHCEVIASVATTSKSEIVAQALANVGKLPVADAPAAEAAAWRNGKDVKEEERTGLWHMRFPGDPVTTSAYAASDLTFTDPDTLYRRAAPGTKEGDPYNEAAYAGVAG